MEALIKAGAFDSLGGYRSQMMAVLEDAVEMGNKMQQDKRQGQLSFFDTFESDQEFKKQSHKLPDVTPWPQPQLLQYEKSVLGFYVTDHPLSEYAEKIHYYSTAHSNSLRQKTPNTEVIIGGIISRMRYCVTKSGRSAGARMAMFTLEDLNGSVDGVIFPNDLARYDELMQTDRMVFLRGMVDFRREDPSIRVSEVYDMTRAVEELTFAVSVRLVEDNLTPEHLRQFKALCRSYAGRCPVYVEVTSARHLRVVMQIEASVRPDEDFCRKLEAMVGAGNYQLLRPHDQLKVS